MVLNIIKLWGLVLIFSGFFSPLIIGFSMNSHSWSNPRCSNKVVLTAKPLIRIGTRGSPLALYQAHETKRLLEEHFDELRVPDSVEIVVKKTTGDMILDKPLAEIGGKGLFTKELDSSLLNGEVDICVHSMKDVPTWLVPGTMLPCNLEREDTRDAFISGNPLYKKLSDLPDGSVVGSASLRRQSQLLAKNPKLKVVNFRGNVQSRLQKLRNKVVDATLLAYAGLLRMEMTDSLTSVIDKDEMLPAVGQGAIGIQCRSDDTVALKYLATLNHQDTKTCVDCERAFLETLDGNCRTPIAGQAVITNGILDFKGLIAKVDGSEVFNTALGGKPEDAVAIGKEAGEYLKSKAPHLVGQ
jgi:hydroxymethylbilane synthase